MLAKSYLRFYPMFMVSPRTVRITDPQVLRALTHPLRMRLLGLLRSDGPSTASRLGARVGESSGATSYHLRELARYGFVEDAPELGTGRERWWRALHEITSWDNESFDPELVSVLQRRIVEVRARHYNGWLDDLGTVPDIAQFADRLLHLTPEQTRQLGADLSDVLSRWYAVSAAPGTDGTHQVVAFGDALPVTELRL